MQTTTSNNIGWLLSGSQLTTYPISFGLFLKEDIKRRIFSFYTVVILQFEKNIQMPFFFNIIYFRWLVAKQIDIELV